MCFKSNKFLYFSSVILMLAAIACSKTSTTPVDAPVIIPVKPPVVVQKDSLTNGVDLQPSYYNNGNPEFAWDTMKAQTKIKTVRIEIEPDKITQAKTWIAQAKAHGFKVIATYHKYTVLGSDNLSDLMDAANWWKANYAVLGSGFTINLINEWGSHNITAATYAADYNSAIAVVRAVYSGFIIIDIPGYGQETYTAYQACKTSTPTIIDTNIILSAHIYPNGYNQGRNHTIQAADLDDISNAGRLGIIGEFGNGITGPADWSGIIDKAKAKGWPVLGWCWNGDGGTMNMIQPSWASNATATNYSKSAYFQVIYNKL